MDMSEGTKLLLEMLQNKDAMLQELADGITEMDQIFVGTQTVLQSVETGTDANVRKQLKNNMAAMMKLSKRMRQLLLVTLVTVSSDGFSSDIAKLGIRTGRGQDFLQEMLKQKMKGF